MLIKLNLSSRELYLIKEALGIRLSDLMCEYKNLDYSSSPDKFTFNREIEELKLLRNKFKDELDKYK